MYLCVAKYADYAAWTGETLEEAYEKAKIDTGNEPEDFRFYEVGKEIKVEQRLIVVE